jgi:hypothetical protein
VLIVTLEPTKAKAGGVEGKGKAEADQASNRKAKAKRK